MAVVSVYKSGLSRKTFLHVFRKRECNMWSGSVVNVTYSSGSRTISITLAHHSANSIQWTIASMEKGAQKPLSYVQNIIAPCIMYVSATYSNELPPMKMYVRGIIEAPKRLNRVSLQNDRSIHLGMPGATQVSTMVFVHSLFVMVGMPIPL